MKKIISLPVLLIFLLIHRQLFSQDLTAYEKHLFQTNNFHLPYRLLRPASVDSTKTYPLIVFLHGAGHKGVDNEKQLNIGGYFFMSDSIRVNYPAYVLFPQCPADDSWAYFDSRYNPELRKFEIDFPFDQEPTTVTATLKLLLDSLKTLATIDSSRIYLAGLSQGAMGVLDMIARWPHMFAGAISFCGAGKANTAKLFAGTISLWLFHGDSDSTLPVEFSRDYYKQLRRLKSDVRYTEYKGVGHNCWVRGLKEPGLMQWLFSRRNRN